MAPANCPQPALISIPRLNRTVTRTPWLTNTFRKFCTRIVDEPGYGYSLLGLSVIKLTMLKMPLSCFANAWACSVVSLSWSISAYSNVIFGLFLLHSRGRLSSAYLVEIACLRVTI